MHSVCYRTRFEKWIRKHHRRSSNSNSTEKPINCVSDRMCCMWRDLLMQRKIKLPNSSFFKNHQQNQLKLFHLLVTHSHRILFLFSSFRFVCLFALKRWRRWWWWRRTERIHSIKCINPKRKPAIKNKNKTQKRMARKKWIRWRRMVFGETESECDVYIYAFCCGLIMRCVFHSRCIYNEMKQVFFSV